MIFRCLLGIAITSFWLVMMGLLYKKHFNPEHSDLAVIEPVVVMERFLGSGLESSLDIWKGNEIVGILRLEPRKGILKDEKAKKAFQVSTQAEMDLPLPGVGTKKITLKNDLMISPDSTVHANNLELSLNQPFIMIKLQSGNPTVEPSLAILQGDQEIFNSKKARSSLENGSSMSLAGLLGSMFGLDISQIKAQEQQASSQQWQTTARRGNFQILDKSFSGYIQKTSMGANRDFTLFLGESGDVLQMKISFLDYIFINQDLRPDGVVAYGVKSESKKQN